MWYDDDEEQEMLCLGIEFGSTRIKAVLIDESQSVVAEGVKEWENQLINGIWTYTKEQIINGLQDCFASLKKDYESSKFHKNQTLKKINAIGISAMMHGYIALDKDDNLLVDFRTWRNTNTKKASDELSELFQYNIPMRWSIAHLYNAILNDEPHVKNIAKITTLAGYIHYLLTGEFVLGIGDASGMFPITDGLNYNQEMVKKFNELIKDRHYPWTLMDILPHVKGAGQRVGSLTLKGRDLLDVSKELSPDGVFFCPPEGDAQTGMVCTGTVLPTQANISAGTSIFAMVVLDKPLKKYYKEIDMVTTPVGLPVAMIHCNNCTSDINAYMSLFKEVLESYGVNPEDIYTKFFLKALEGDKDCGNLISFNYFSGEPITGVNEAKPLLIRPSDGHLGLNNLMKSIIFSSLCTLSIGMDILKKEGVDISVIRGHGGFFNTKEVAARYMSAALGTPISVVENSNLGGAYGMAILAYHMLDYMEFAEQTFTELVSELCWDDEIINCKKKDVKEFKAYLRKYKKMLKVEKMAGKVKI